MLSLLPSPSPPPCTLYSLIDSIKRLSSNGNLSAAFASFSLLRHHSLPHSYLLVDPIASLLSASVSVSVSLRSSPHYEQLHSLALSLGFAHHPALLPRLVSIYSSSGLLSLAHRSVEGSLDVRSWNTLLSFYVRARFTKNALNAYKEMVGKDVDPDAFTYPTVLKACGQAKDLGLGREIHHRYNSSGLDWNLFVHNALVDMYAKCGELGAAREMFDEMRVRDLVSWNSMILAYAGRGMQKEAFEMFDRMWAEGAEANCVTWNTIASVKLKMGRFGEALGLISQMRWSRVGMDVATMVVGLNACSQVRSVRLGKEIHGLVIRSCCDGFETVTNTLIVMYSRCNDIDVAHLLFRRAINRSLITWNAMVTGFAIHDQAEEASMVFREMVWSGYEPNYVTIVVLSSLCARVANLQHGRELHCFITKQGFDNYRLIWNSLVDMYSKAGKISTAQRVFDTMTDRDQVSYTSLISGYGVQGEGMKALQLFDEMISSGIEPDTIAMVTVLSACSHSGLISEGQELFDNMSKSYGIKPKMEHYSCLIDLYARAGLLEEAEDILHRMPFQPSSTIWAAVLNACAVHRNTEIGERAANRLLEMNTQNAGHYVLIANMYAAAGCWEELAKVRMMMRDRGVRKAPGVAWVDIGKGFRPFAVGDRSNPLAPEIYLALEGLIEQMRDIGYVDIELGIGEEFGGVDTPENQNIELFYQEDLDA